MVESPYGERFDLDRLQTGKRLGTGTPCLFHRRLLQKAERFPYHAGQEAGHLQHFPFQKHERSLGKEPDGLPFLCYGRGRRGDCKNLRLGSQYSRGTTEYAGTGRHDLRRPERKRYRLMGTGTRKVPCDSRPEDKRDLLYVCLSCSFASVHLPGCRRSFQRSGQEYRTGQRLYELYYFLFVGHLSRPASLV